VSGDYLRKFVDQAKPKNHAPAIESAGATFLPAALSVLSAWGPTITTEFNLLWKAEVEAAKAAGEAEWPVIQRKMLWRANISVALMRANAQMLLSRSARRVARVHSTLRTRTVPAARTSQATALRHSARRTTISTTATASARINVPSASRPTELRG
jgi:hypothetical protein